MNEVCGDNRFEIIQKAKEALLNATNIESSPDEVKVLDSILFRAWQMGWLDKYEPDYKERMKKEYYMPIEEHKRRLEEAETRAQVAESDAAILRECIVRMNLERYGVLR